MAKKDFRGGYRKNFGRIHKDTRRYTVHRRCPSGGLIDDGVGFKSFLSAGLVVVIIFSNLDISVHNKKNVQIGYSVLKNGVSTHTGFLTV
jgi:hypothetical protein